MNTTNLCKVTVLWHGYVETVVTESPFECKGRVAWIQPVGYETALPYPYDAISSERISHSITH